MAGRWRTRSSCPPSPAGPRRPRTRPAAWREIRKDALTFFERLNFAGIRLIAVSQGIDSDNEQAHVLVTVHGMVDSLYVKELAKKTHRGLEGRVLRGQHTGGRCYGYDSVSVDDTTAKHL